MKKIKILYFVDRLDIGGIQTFIFDIIKNLQPKFQIDVLTLDDGKVYEYVDLFKKSGINVYKLDNIWINSPIDYIKYQKAATKFFKENKYDIVHLHASSKNYLLMKIAKKSGISVRIAHSHSLGFQTNSKFKKLIGELFKNKLIKYSTHFFACSDLAGKWLFDKKQFTVINNGIKLERFTFDEKIRNDLRGELMVKNDELLLGHVGRFTTQKNHSYLIHVFAEIVKQNKKAKLILLGSGELEDNIKSLVKKLNLDEKVIFAGFKTNANEYFQAIDAFILPSQIEGLGIVLIEAQAAGIPCFASKDSIPKEAKITDLVQFISLNEKPKVWAEAILNTDMIRKDTVADIKKKEYTIEATCEKLQKIYEMSVDSNE